MEKTSNLPIYQRTESVGSVSSFDRESLRTYLENESLLDFNDRFPEDASLDLFRSLTEDDLEHDYGVKDANDRNRLMHAIVRLRDEDSDDENESDFDRSADSQSEVFGSSTLPRNFRINRLSDEFCDGRRRRDSFGYSPSRYDETSNLVRMRGNPSLGNSEPNLSGSCSDLSRRLSTCNVSGGRKQARSFIGTCPGPLTPPRPFSPFGPTSPASISSESPGHSPVYFSPGSSLNSQFAFSNIRKSETAGRRWSVASLTSSGYGTHTPTSSSYSSLASSQEKLHQIQSLQYADEYGCYGQHFSGADSDQDDELMASGRRSPRHFKHQRSRSLSPSRTQTQEGELQMLNNLYRERFPKAVTQMEEHLNEFIEEYTSDAGCNQYGCDGVLNFVWHQVVEAARDVLNKSQDNSLTSLYFYDLSENLQRLLFEASQKTEVDVTPVRKLIRKLLMIASRPARLLECLEFKPGEFYTQLEEERLEMAYQSSGVKMDITNYVKTKLGVCNEDEQEEQTSPRDKDDIELQNHPITKGEPPTEDDFEYIKLISNGAYGAVYLVRHKRTQMRFAMKKMNKHMMMLRNQTEQVFAERDILTFAENPFVVGMWCCLETKKHLCMVMEYVEGGDCASLLKNIGPLPLDLARMYFAETVLALEYLHSYGIVHRDMKPDNLLITSLGHIKLTDFGLSKIGLMNSTTHMYERSLDRSFMDRETKLFTDKQVFGTPDYIAPEVILRQGYGKPVDWWAMGIILYEFLLGVPPFYGDSPEDLFAHTLSGEIEWPEGDEAPAEDAQDLIKKLLEQDPIKRLGTGGAHEVKEHPFFIGLDWTALLRQKAEFIPQLDSEEDTSYFDTRCDRYNHSFETDDDEDDQYSDFPEFSNFSTCSPRYSRICGSPGPTSPVNANANLFADHPKEEQKQSNGLLTPKTNSSTSTAAESSPPTVRRKAITKKEQSSLDGDNDFFRRRSDSGFSQETGQTDVDSDTVSPRTPRDQTNVQTPSTPPTVRSRKKGDNRIGPPLLSIAIDHTQAPKQVFGRPRHFHGSFDSSVKIPLLRTQSLPPERVRSKTVPKLELPGSDEEGHYLSVTTESPPLSPHSHKTPPSSPFHRRRRTSSAISLNLRPPIVIGKGPRGYGFTLQAIRVYFGDTNYYTVHHLVSVGENPGKVCESWVFTALEFSQTIASVFPGYESMENAFYLLNSHWTTSSRFKVHMNVEHGSAAFEAGLRPSDLLTHVNEESIMGLTHRQVVELILGGGNKVKLTATELSKTSIKTGGRKRTVANSKRVRKRRKGRRSGGSPTLPSPSSQEFSDKPKQRSFWKKIGRRNSHSAGGSLRRASSLKRVSSSPESKIHRPVSPKLSSPPFDFRNMSDYSSSHSSSPASSPSSPSTQYTRPGSLQGLIPKLRAVRSPRRKTSSHGLVPVSPLARTPSPTSGSPSYGHAPRSTSPLTIRTSSSSHFGSPTPSTSPRTETPLLRRALSPELKLKFDNKTAGDLPSRAKEESVQSSKEK